MLGFNVKRFFRFQNDISTGWWKTDSIEKKPRVFVFYAQMNFSQLVSFRQVGLSLSLLSKSSLVLRENLTGLSLQLIVFKCLLPLKGYSKDSFSSLSQAVICRLYSQRTLCYKAACSLFIGCFKQPAVVEYEKMFGGAYGSAICGLSVVDGLMIVAYCQDSFD